MPDDIREHDPFAGLGQEINDHSIMMARCAAMVAAATLVAMDPIHTGYESSKKHLVITYRSIFAALMVPPDAAKV